MNGKMGLWWFWAKLHRRRTIYFWVTPEIYYFLLKSISHVEIHKSTTGFGLYDKRALDILKTLQEPYPYLRGMISEAGLPVTLISFDKPQRTHGKTKNNFFSLYDLALTGFVNHSLVPLKIITALGILLSFFCFVISIAYFLYKLFYWEEFTVGIAPLLFGGFFISGILLLSIGIIGEYIAIIHVNIRNHPLVVERHGLTLVFQNKTPRKMNTKVSQAKQKIGLKLMSRK